MVKQRTSRYVKVTGRRMWIIGRFGAEWEYTVTGNRDRDALELNWAADQAGIPRRQIWRYYPRAVEAQS